MVGRHDFSEGLLEWLIPARTPFIRIHHESRGPVWFGPGAGHPPAYRFDAPAGEFGVMYVAEHLEGAFVETVLRKRTGRIVVRTFVEARQWTRLSSDRPLVLAKAFDEGLSFHGLDSNISSSDSYADCQAFALAVHSTFPHVDGIAYRSRHDNGQISYALFERCALPSPLTDGGATRFDAVRPIIDDLMHRYGAHWDLSPPLPGP